MEHSENIKKRMAELKRLVAQFYEEIDAMEADKSPNANDLTPIAGGLEDNLDLLNKELAVVFEPPKEEQMHQLTALQRISVESSMASAVGYDAAQQTLYVEFADSGKIYAYYQVEQDIFEELLKANSKGTFILDNVIGGYNYSLVKRKGFRW